MSEDRDWTSVFLKYGCKCADIFVCVARVDNCS